MEAIDNEDRKWEDSLKEGIVDLPHFDDDKSDFFQLSGVLIFSKMVDNGASIRLLKISIGLEVDR